MEVLNRVINLRVYYMELGPRVIGLVTQFHRCKRNHSVVNIILQKVAVLDPSLKDFRLSALLSIFYNIIIIRAIFLVTKATIFLLAPINLKSVETKLQRCGVSMKL